MRLLCGAATIYVKFMQRQQLNLLPGKVKSQTLLLNVVTEWSEAHKLLCEAECCTWAHTLDRFFFSLSEFFSFFLRPMSDKMLLLNNIVAKRKRNWRLALRIVTTVHLYYNVKDKALEFGLEDSVEWMVCTSKIQELSDLFPNAPDDDYWKHRYSRVNFRAFNDRYIKPLEDVGLFFQHAPKMFLLDCDFFPVTFHPLYWELFFFFCIFWFFPCVIFP